MKSRSIFPVSFLVLTMFAISTLVWSAGAGDPERTIPYQGRVEMGGVPFTGSTAMSFTLYDDAAAMPANQLWSAIYDPVAVQGGE